MFTFKKKNTWDDRKLFVFFSYKLELLGFSRAFVDLFFHFRNKTLKKKAEAELRICVVCVCDFCVYVIISYISPKRRRRFKLSFQCSFEWPQLVEKKSHKCISLDFGSKYEYEYSYRYTFF